MYIYSINLVDFYRQKNVSPKKIKLKLLFYNRMKIEQTFNFLNRYTCV